MLQVFFYEVLLIEDQKNELSMVLRSLFDAILEMNGNISNNYQYQFFPVLIFD